MHSSVQARKEESTNFSRAAAATTQHGLTLMRADRDIVPLSAGDYLLECGLQTPELGADTVAGIYATSFQLVAAQPPPAVKPPPIAKQIKPPPPLKKTPPPPPKRRTPPPQPSKKPPPPPPRPTTPAT